MATYYYERDPATGKQVLVGTSTPVRDSNGVIIGHTSEGKTPGSTSSTASTGGTTAKNTTTGGATTNATSTWQPADTSGTNYDQLYMSAADYATAQALRDSWATAEDKQAVHNAVEALRNKYGYSGGEDGSQYIPLDVKQTAGDFSYSPAPTYKDSYSSRIDEMLNEILNRDAFSYNALEDPLYQQYSQQYQREGQRAMQDTLGQVSARTGGMASTYALSAAQQTYNDYASQLADKIPELYQLAYSMYLDDIDLKVQDLGLLESASDRQYSRYRDTMSDWRDDRNFAYDLYRDDIDDQRYQNEWVYQVGQDKIANEHWQANYDRDVYESDRDYDYDVDRNNVEDGRYTKTEAQERVREHILTMGGSAADLPKEVLDAAGFNDAELAAMEKAYADSKAAEKAKTGSGGGGGGGGGDDYTGGVYDNGRLNADQVKSLNAALGVTDDGYGDASKKAAKELTGKELSAEDAYNQVVISPQIEERYGMTYDEYNEAAGHYQEVAAKAEEMYATQGKQAVLDMLNASREGGLITLTNYMSLYKKYRDM